MSSAPRHYRQGRFVCRSVIFGRRIPGYFAVDPLTLPLRERPTFIRKFARSRGLTLSEARVWLGVENTPARFALTTR